MRILAVSDVEDEAITASLPERAGSIDLVLGCGDLTYDYLDFGATPVAAPLRAVHGNHDVPLESLDDPEIGVGWTGNPSHARGVALVWPLFGRLGGSLCLTIGPFPVRG